MEQFDRITQQPDVMGGKACIRGMRVTVGMIVGQIGAGHNIEEILADYPYLEREDICRHCAMQRGGPKSAKSSWPRHEATGRYEPIPTLGEPVNRRRLRGEALVDAWRG